MLVMDQRIQDLRQMAFFDLPSLVLAINGSSDGGSYAAQA